MDMGQKIRVVFEVFAVVWVGSLIYTIDGARSDARKLATSYQEHLVVEYAKICGVDFYKELTRELTEEELVCLDDMRAEAKKEVEAITK